MALNPRGKHAEEARSPELVMADLLFAEVTEGVLTAFFRVYNELGFGFLESVYRRAMRVELALIGRRSAEEVPVEVIYKGVVVGTYRIDLLVDNEVVVEIKSAARLIPDHDAQVLNYLCAIRKPVARSRM